MMKRIILLGLAILILLSGCRQATTVILPPETQSSTQEDTNLPGTSPDTVPTTAPTIPTTQPSDEVDKDPPTDPSTQPSTIPPTQPPTSPPTQPATYPPTQPPARPSAPPPTQPPTESATEPDIYDIGNHSIGNLEWAILAELNGRRTAEGLSELAMDRTLCALAAIRAYELPGNLSHNRPDGRNWSSILYDYGQSGQALGENLLYGTPDYTAGAIVEVWMGSPSHRNLILHPDAGSVGIGVWEQNGQIYIAVIFIA